METRARALLAPGDVATGLSCRIKPGPESWGPLIVQFQFDRHGTRIWKDVKALLDHEHARMRIGAVAVPFRHMYGTVQRLDWRSCVPVPVPLAGVRSFPLR